MRIRIPAAVRHLIPIFVVALELSGCSKHETGQPGPVSSTPPKIHPFPPVKPVRDYPRVASEGGCAPTYRNGTRGACIANKPCRGYGVRNDKSEELCMCYLNRGGCDPKSRCDLLAHGCVPDTNNPNDSE
jgi:hypothetical protein